MHEACAEGKETPSETSGRKPNARWHFLEDEVVGHLAQEVATVEDGVDLVELSSCGWLE